MYETLLDEGFNVSYASVINAVNSIKAHLLLSPRVLASSIMPGGACGVRCIPLAAKKEFKDELKFSLTMNYLFRDNVANKTRSQIKFLYKLVDISCISIVSLYEGVKFSKKIYLILNSFNDELKQELLNITKDVVKTELNYNISKVRANYNIDDLQASWQMPDLLTAIYFSIFFLNPHFEIVKKCANPTCDTFLSAVHSNTRKKYCSTRCANAVSQRNSRIRQ